MIRIEKTEVVGLEPAIRGMRNPMNSWKKSDSYKTHIEDAETLETADFEFFVGAKDLELMQTLASLGPVHAKYRRMIAVYADVTAPLYWWKEFDTYKVGTVANSCSTMHKIHAKKFTLKDFSYDKLINIWDFEPENREMAPIVAADVKCDVPCNYVYGPEDILKITVIMLNKLRKLYLQSKEKSYWYTIIQLLPSSYNQKRTLMLNYEVLANIYRNRKEHKLDEWWDFCRWIEELPYSELITRIGDDE